MTKSDGRGRPKQEKVKLSKSGENSTRMVPLHEDQIEEAGVDPEAEEIKVKRKPRQGKKEIRLELIEEDES